MSGHDNAPDADRDSTETLESLEDIGIKRADVLREAGCRSTETLRGASEVELASLSGIGDDVARAIKRQVGSRHPADATRTVYTTQVTPEEWSVTPRQAAYLEELSGIDAEELVETDAADLLDRLEYRIDPDLLGYRVVCGEVVAPDPQTGDPEPVPNATVHVEDTDCSLLGFFPHQSSLGWLYPTFCRTETVATVQTNACGEFCVYVPLWEIDRILDYRQERICLPDLVKPSIRDLLEEHDLLPRWPDVPDSEPGTGPRPRPGPQPDPLPLQLDEPAAFDRLQELVDEETAVRLSEGGDLTFGESTAGRSDLLSRPAFRDFEPPLPADFADEGLPAAVEELFDFDNPHELSGQVEQFAAIDAPEQHLQEFSADRYVGPFIRCHDVVVPEWVPLLDVPDVTFRVTQDVDGDGQQETIYDEGHFDVRWDANPIPDVTLVADGSAQSVPTCDVPDVDENECDGPTIVTAGLMSLKPKYHDNSAGVGLRPNRPWTGGFNGSGSRTTSEAPYANRVQLYGCVRFDDAEYYRFLHSYEGNARKPFTKMEWTEPGGPGDPSVLFTPDANGWYQVHPKADLWFDHWLFNWNTHAYPDGHYEITLQTADGSKSVLDESDPVAFLVDNDDPDVEYSVEVSKSGSSTWDSISGKCPIIERGESETVQLKVNYTASDDYFRDVTVSATGCGPNPKKPSSASRSDYEHWYTTPSDKSHSGTARFDIPPGHPDGTYSIRINANSRAFNPSGGRGGPGKNWKYDGVYSRSHPRTRISVITK